MTAFLITLGTFAGFALGLWIGRAERRTKLACAQITANAYRELAAIVESEAKRQRETNPND